MFQSHIAPQRIVLKPNLNYERQDTTRSDARTSVDHSDKHGGTYRETCGEIDFRISKDCPIQLSATTRSHPQKGSPEIDSPVRESPEQRIIVLTLYMLRSSVDHLLTLCKLLPDFLQTSCLCVIP